MKKNGVFIFVISHIVPEIFTVFVLSGAIIGDGDRKRAPFIVLGLAP